MKTNAVSTLKYVALVAAIVVIACLAAINLRTSSNEPSPECVKIRRDVAANVHVGGSENTIIPFFKKQGWKYASGSVLGLYNAEIHIRRTLIGEDQFVRVYIEVKDGLIVRIEVSDQVRFL